MKTSFVILSTKKLNEDELHLLQSAGLAVTNVDFIERAIHLPEKIDHHTIHETVVLTSTMSIKAWLALAAREGIDVSRHPVFCMEYATKQKALSEGLNILATATNASSLADEILKRNIPRVTFVCGNIRRDELPMKLKMNGVEVSEIIAYRTDLAPKKFENYFQGILFFSPSAIDSFLLQNTIGDSIAFCIGNTTAKHAAECGFYKIQVADSPSARELVKSVINFYLNNPAHA